MHNPQFLSAAEFAAQTFAQETFVTDPLMPTGGVMMIHGHPGLGKTQVALALALAVAKGEKWLGEYPCQAASVVFLQADMPPQLFQQRVQRIPDIASYDRLHFLTVEDMDILEVRPGSVEALQKLD